MSQRCQYRNSLAIGMTHVDRQRSLRADALEHTETRDVHERHYACQLEAGVLEERPLRWARSPWSLGERASRLVRMATGRSSSRRHIARGDPSRLLGDALELAKCPGADRLYLRDRSACGRRHSDRNRV